MLRAFGDEDEDEDGFLRRLERDKPPTKETLNAFMYLLAPLERGEGLRVDKRRGNILVWYETEMRRHFLSNFRDGLIKVWIVYLVICGWIN